MSSSRIDTSMWQQETMLPQVMGILNVTPDSFFDGGKHNLFEDAISHAKQMIAEGVDIIDIGGESTRPHAKYVSCSEQIARVIPVIKRIREFSQVPISVDTSEPELMEQAIAAGADMINDVRALEQDGALEVAASLGVPVCIMHKRVHITETDSPYEYQDVVKEVINYFAKRVDECCRAGIELNNIIIDPGFCFGKALVDNIRLLRHLPEFSKLQLPVLVGVSRKSMIGQILDLPVEDRIYGSIAAAILSGQKGAAIIRVHDVAATKQALQLVYAIEHEEL